VDSRLSVNGSQYYFFIDPEVDLAAEQWKHLSHHDWILPSPLD
ncbi:MAG TPA: HTTM domain-containing protein, partial [Salinimicrobium sp.]|nr:HTTM domain-containing protein [Salinimicrobium sp.]